MFHKVTFELSGALITAAAAATALRYFLNLGLYFPARTILIFGMGIMAIRLYAHRHLHAPTLGSANRVTLLRAIFTALLFAFIGERRSSEIAWFIVILSSVSVILDGVDGWLARRDGRSSPFGARFDMETDALLICAIALLAWQFEKAGPWILAAGLMRYIFVAAAWVWRWMAQPLPFSNRRRTVCVVQELALILCLIPFLNSPLSDAIAFAGLAVLSASFMIDVAWLIRHRTVSKSSL